MYVRLGDDRENTQHVPPVDIHGFLRISTNARQRAIDLRYHFRLSRTLGYSTDSRSLPRYRPPAQRDWKS